MHDSEIAMTEGAGKSADWSAIRKQLASFEKPELIALVKDLYDGAAGNRDFIQARCGQGGSTEGILERYRARIVNQFFPAQGEGKLRLGEAKQAIREYRKATANVSGTVELLMTYVENGARFTEQYGDIDERFYSSIESALMDLAVLLRGEARALYPQFKERLADVEQATQGIGWGFHDSIGDVVGQLESELGKTDNRSA